jgi:hypothetical protein
VTAYLPAALGIAKSRPLAPAGVPALRIAPGGTGDMSGSSWANAAPIQDVTRLIATAAWTGSEVWVRADAGPYWLDETLVIDKGGFPGKPVIVRGVDVLGRDMKAEIVGSRAAPWQAGLANGADLFWLDAGASHLSFSSLLFRDQGTIFRLRQANTDLSFTDIDCFNFRRFVQNNRSAGNTGRIQRLRIQRCRGFGFSKQFIIIRYDSSDFLVEDCWADAENQTGDNFVICYQLDETAHNGVFRRCTALNAYNVGPGSYWNSDGFCNEYGNTDVLYEDCYAAHCTDGGWDCKGSRIHLLRCVSEDNKRSYRMWGDALLEDCSGINPFKRGGTGATFQVGAMQGGRARVRVKGGTWTQSTISAPFRSFDNAVLAIDDVALAGVQKPAGTPLHAIEARDPTDSLFSIWDHADTVAPELTGPLAFFQAENDPVRIRLGTTEHSNMRLRGIDAAACFVSGRDLGVYAQDFDAPGGPSKAGGPTLRVEIQLIDVNGNLSEWTPVEITITDVEDDPIGAAELVAQPGVTNGYWRLATDPGAFWADFDMTVPAELGDRVLAWRDLSGFGNHMIAVDESRAGLLVMIEGYVGVYFDGASTVYRQGALGEFRFPQLTAWAGFNRDPDDGDARSFLLAHGRRKVADDGSNGAFWLAVEDFSYASYRTSGSNGGANGAVRDEPHVASYRSTDGLFQVDSGNANDGNSTFDGQNVAAIGYPLPAEQALVGARWNGTSYTGHICGVLFGTACVNATVNDAIKSRMDLQVLRAGGGFN